MSYFYFIYLYTFYIFTKTKVICYNLVEKNVILNYCMYLGQTRFTEILKQRNIKKIIMITGSIILGHSV